MQCSVNRSYVGCSDDSELSVARVIDYPAAA